MRLIPSKRFTNRQVSYEFMNRQMVWHAFTVSHSSILQLSCINLIQEFLLLVLPIFGSRAFRRAYKQVSSRLQGLSVSSILPSALKSKVRPTKSTIQKGKYFSLSSDQCAICAESASFDLSSLASNPGAFASSLANMSMASSNGAMAEDSKEGGPPTHPVNTPYRASCGHEYCYFCLSDKLLRAVDDGDDGWECLRCKEIVRSAYRVVAIPEEDDIASDDLGSEIGTPLDSNVSLSSSSLSR